MNTNSNSNNKNNNNIKNTNNNNNVKEGQQSLGKDNNNYKIFSRLWRMLQYKVTIQGIPINKTLLLLKKETIYEVDKKRNKESTMITQMTKTSCIDSQWVSDLPIYDAVVMAMSFWLATS